MAHTESYDHIKVFTWIQRTFPPIVIIYR